jgi:hypothetical protein
MTESRRMVRDGNCRDDDYALDTESDSSDIRHVVAHEDIDIVVAQIRRLVRTASLEFALRVGAVIIHHFYDGDTDAWRSRGPKTSSFRSLARHPDLPLSAGALYRCVAIFELCERLNAPSRWEHLGVSHLRLVLGLPTTVQERVLVEANAKRWTVKALQQVVFREKTASVSRGGRRPTPAFAKSLQRVRKCLDEHRDLLEQTARVSSQELEQSIYLVEEARQCLDRLSSSLLARTEDRDVAPQRASQELRPPSMRLAVGRCEAGDVASAQVHR